VKYSFHKLKLEWGCCSHPF